MLSTVPLPCEGIAAGLASAAMVDDKMQSDGRHRSTAAAKVSGKNTLLGCWLGPHKHVWRMLMNNNSWDG